MKKYDFKIFSGTVSLTYDQFAEYRERFLIIMTTIVDLEAPLNYISLKSGISLSIIL